nr:hypothetical protein [Tanacetum cinerariifolium]
MHNSQPGGSGTDEGTGSKPGVPDVPTNVSEEELSWNSSDDEGANDQEKVSDDDEGDEGNDHKEREEDDDAKDKDGDEIDDGDEDQEITKDDEQDDTERSGMILRKVKVMRRIMMKKQGTRRILTLSLAPLKAVRMKVMVRRIKGSGLQATLEVEDTHVTLTLINSDGQQESSSVSSQFVTSMLNPTTDVDNFSEFRQTNSFAEAVSIIPSIVHQYMNQQMNEAVRVAVQIQTNRLRKAYQRENDEFLRTIDENIKRIKKEQVKDEVLTRSSHSSRTSYAVAADLSKVELTKILIKKMEGNKCIQCSDEQRNLYKALMKDPPPNQTGGLRDEEKASTSESAFAEEPVHTTSQMDEPSYSVFETELEYHLEEVYKATTDQLDWFNPEGQQYPHNLLHPLPLIPDNRGRRVIPFAHFIISKYTTSVTKTKAADYGKIKWIEDLESALDVYSKRRIIAVTDLKIVEWHSYKHLDWITVRRDDDKLYKFKEGDFKRLRLQDIEDMLLLLVQGKLTNLTVEECFAFNVSLRMFTRSIVIQRHVEDLQLGVKSYQKRKGDKDRAAAMIQAIDKMLKTRRIMRSLEKFVEGRLSILMDLQETLKRKWRYLIPADSQIHNHMLIPNYQDIIFQDFCYFDEFECYQVIKIGSFGVDAAMDLEEKRAAEGRLMLLSQVKTVNHKCC